MLLVGGCKVSKPYNDLDNNTCMQHDRPKILLGYIDKEYMKAHIYWHYDKSRACLLYQGIDKEQ